MRSPSRVETRGGSTHAERGSVTAEFAAVVPAVLLVLACCLSAMQLAGQQIRLQDASADAARSLARGDPAATAAGRASALVRGARLAVEPRGDLVCARLAAPAAAAVPIFASIELSASSCALSGGR